MDEGSKLDFTGQHIYVGMDIHKKSWSVSIHTEHFEHKTFTQPPEIKKLAYYLQRNFPGATYHSVYEAGFSGFWIHDLLTEVSYGGSVFHSPTNIHYDCESIGQHYGEKGA